MNKTDAYFRAGLPGSAGVHSLYIRVQTITTPVLIYVANSLVKFTGSFLIYLMMMFSKTQTNKPNYKIGEK